LRAFARVDRDRIHTIANVLAVEQVGELAEHLERQAVAPEIEVLRKPGVHLLVPTELPNDKRGMPARATTRFAATMRVPNIFGAF